MQIPNWKHIPVILLIAATGACDGDNGRNGMNGTPGTDGADGTDGLTSLVNQVVLPIGEARCGVGGLLIESGLDLDGNQVLDATEVVDSNVICDGSTRSVLDPALVAQGRETFRFDTFGDEALWTDTLQMHTVIENNVSPRAALAVGLKVDADALPPGILDSADLDDPATTVALIGLNAVVGIQGTVEAVNGQDRLTSVGVTCALCHSDVDDSVMEGIGTRLDGFPNRTLDPGLILSLSPALSDPASQAVLTSWGPGKYDAFWNLDGRNDPAVIPPAYGLNGIHLATFTGEGDISYWNAYVAVTQMGGQGDFKDERLGIDIEVQDDLVTPKLEGLKHYQWSLLPPQPTISDFDAEAAGRGKVIFDGAGRCATCHAGSLFTDANVRLHEPFETGTDDTLAMRATTGQYRTTPLAGVSSHPPFFHDGSAATLADVVAHYDNHLGLALSLEDREDLVEYLKSL